MVVLWWLVPPLVATALAMVWVSWYGRRHRDRVRDDSPAAMHRMQRALAKPVPTRGTRVPVRQVEPTHGVALRAAGDAPSSERAGSR